MIRNYEFMFIVTPDTTEEERAAAVAYVEAAFKAAGADNMVVDKIGEKKLAYPINKKSTGYYALAKFTMEGEKMSEAENKININDKIVRYILVKKEK